MSVHFTCHCSPLMVYFSFFSSFNIFTAWFFYNVLNMVTYIHWLTLLSHILQHILLQNPWIHTYIHMYSRLFNMYVCIQVCTYVTRFAKTRHNGALLQIQIFASVRSIYLKLCSVAIPMLYCKYFSSYKAR